MLQRHFRLEPGEFASVARFAALGLLLQAGLALGTTAADSIFLVNVGADKLPHIYLLTPVVMMLYIPAYSFLLGRWGVERVFDLTLGVLVTGGLALGLAFQAADGNYPIVLCYAAKLYAALWYVGTYTLFWNFIDNYFDLLDAKRLFALFAAGSATGAIIGGALAGPLSEAYGVEPLFFGWAISAAVAWPLAQWTRRRARRLDPGTSVEDTAGDFGPAEALRNSVRLLKSRYASVLTVLLFATLVTATICEFQYMTVFSEGLDEADLAGLLGRLTAIVNVLNLALTLFVFNRLVARLGVRNVALIQPVAYAAVFTWMLLDYGFLSAAAGFVAFQGLMVAIDYNNVNLLFSGLPTAARGQLRTLIEGIGEPLATATAGVLLFFFGAGLPSAQVSIWGILGAAVCLGLVFALRADFASAIAANLRRESLDFSRRPTPPGAPSPSDLALAAEQVRSAGPGEAVLALRLLAAGDPAGAAEALLNLLRTGSVAHQQAVRPLLDEFLADPDSPIGHEIHRWLDRNPLHSSDALAGDLGGRRLLPSDLAPELAGANDARIRAAGAVMLWQSWRIEDNTGALDEIRRLLSSPDDHRVVAGLDATGRLAEARYAYLLRDFLHHPSAAVRAAALRAFSQLAGPASSPLLKELYAIVESGTAEERSYAFDAIERIGETAATEPLLRAAQRVTPADRRRIEHLILRFGPRTVPLLTAVAQSPQYPLAARCLALRAIARIAFPQVDFLAQPLIVDTLRRAYHFLAAHQALAKAGPADPALAVLARICRDYPLLATEIVLETLSIAGRLPSHEAALAGLRGEQSKERGYAIETIEQACDRKSFRLLLPLIDGRDVAAQAAFGHDEGIAPVRTLDEVIEQSLSSDFPLEAAAGLQAWHGRNPDAGAAPLFDRLRRQPDPLIRDTLLNLLERRQGAVKSYTPVEIAHRLLSTPALGDSLFLHHEFLVPRSRIEYYAAGAPVVRRGADFDGLRLVLAGELSAGGAGTLLGRTELYGSCGWRADCLAKTPADVLLIPRAALTGALALHPSLSLALLRDKLSR